MTTTNIDPGCSVCGQPDPGTCGCEALALDQAMQIAEEIVMRQAYKELRYVRPALFVLLLLLIITIFFFFNIIFNPYRCSSSSISSKHPSHEANKIFSSIF